MIPDTFMLIINLTFSRMRRTMLIFGSLAAAILILFELNKLSVWPLEDSSDLFIILSGTLFIVIGFLLSRFFNQKQGKRNVTWNKTSKLTKQEHKILVLMDEGLSNQEIAESMFIAESTVKSHVSNILTKLQAKRRTEALKIARNMEII